MKCFIPLALLVVAVVAAPPGSFWNPCTTTAYTFAVSDLTMPNPVTNPTFNISLSGTLSKAVTAGSMKMALSFDGIPFYSETDNLCNLGTACPMAAGPIKFVMQKTFPQAPFQGTITGTVNAYDGSNNLLTCIKLQVTVNPPVKKGPEVVESKTAIQQSKPLQAPPGTWWNLCSTTTTYPLKVTDVTMPVPVTNPNVTISFGGILSETLSGGTVVFALSFDGIPIFNESDDLCSFGVACPINPGQVTFTVTKNFPSPPFSGTITGTVTGYDSSKNTISCVKLNVPVNPSQK